MSRHAEQVFVCLFEGDTETHRFALPQRLGDVHYGVIDGLMPGMRYGLRAAGPWAPEQGHRFDLSKLQVDPYATQLDRPFRHDVALTQFGAETAALVPKCIVDATPADANPLPPAVPGFIYEVPVKAFTQLHPV